MKLQYWHVLSCIALLSLGIGPATAQQPWQATQSLSSSPPANAPIYPHTSAVNPYTAALPAPEQGVPIYNGANTGAWAGYGQEPVQYGYPQAGDGGYHGNVYDEAMSSPSWGGDCTSCLPSACGPAWFGGIYGLYMTRDQENEVWLSVDDYATGGTGAGVLGTRDAAMDWQDGIEARFGRVFCGGLYAWEAVYWGIFSDQQEANAIGTDYIGDLITPLTVNNLNIGVNNVADWYDDAARHRLRRSYEIHNVELNLLRLPLYGQGGSCFNCGCALGVRYFRFNEGFQFSTDDTNTTFGDVAVDELHYNVNMENNLIGVQMGCLADYRWGCRFSMFTDLKFGLYNNYITHHSNLVDGAGTVATVNNGPNDGRDFNVSSNKNDVAFLGELRLGVGYQITPRWRATAAYRAIALTGVALTTNQIPVNFGDLRGVGRISSNGSLILHGAQFGLETRF